MKLSLLLASLLSAAHAFAPIAPSTTMRPSVAHATTGTFLVDPTSAFDMSLTIAETESWVQPTSLFLDVFLNFLSFAMLARVVLSWYPAANLKEAPWIFLVVPTEPLLRAFKVPPAFGVDITPVAWLGLFTFIHEILLGQQGLFTMKMKYGI